MPFAARAFIKFVALLLGEREKSHLAAADKSRHEQAAQCED